MIRLHSVSMEMSDKKQAASQILYQKDDATLSSNEL